MHDYLLAAARRGKKAHLWYFFSFYHTCIFMIMQNIKIINGCPRCRWAGRPPSLGQTTLDCISHASSTQSVYQKHYLYLGETFALPLTHESVHFFKESLSQYRLASWSQFLRCIFPWGNLFIEIGSWTSFFVLGRTVHFGTGVAKFWCVFWVKFLVFEKLVLVLFIKVGHEFVVVLSFFQRLLYVRFEFHLGEVRIVLFYIAIIKHLVDGGTLRRILS